MITIVYQQPLGGKTLPIPNCDDAIYKFKLFTRKLQFNKSRNSRIISKITKLGQNYRIDIVTAFGYFLSILRRQTCNQH